MDSKQIYTGEGLMHWVENSPEYKNFTIEDLNRAIKELCKDDGNRVFRQPLIKETYDKKGNLKTINWGQWIEIKWNIKDGYPGKQINDSVQIAKEMGFKLPIECEWYRKGLELVLKANDII